MFSPWSGSQCWSWWEENLRVNHFHPSTGSGHKDPIWISLPSCTGQGKFMLDSCSSLDWHQVQRPGCYVHESYAPFPFSVLCFFLPCAMPLPSASLDHYKHPSPWVFSVLSVALGSLLPSCPNPLYTFHLAGTRFLCLTVSIPVFSNSIPLSWASCSLCTWCTFRLTDWSVTL